MSHARGPGSILRERGSAVHELYLQTSRVKRLQLIVDPYLASIASDARVAAFDGHTLTLTLSTVTAAPLATRLRYATPQLVRSLCSHTEFHGLKDISIKVRPHPETPAVEPPKRPPISADTARQIERTAKYIEDDSLRKALESLAKTAKKPD